MKRLPWILATTGFSFALVLSACGDDDNEDTGNDEVGDGDGDQTGDGDGDQTGDGDGDQTGDGDGEPGNCADPSDPNATIVPVTGDINSDTTWTCDNIYRLAPDTHVFVNGAVLTIEPGTTIQGTAGSALVIEKDARIEAVGTADAPIVFTSTQASPAAGDWGGLVLLGRAVVNLEGGVGQAEGFASAPTYGGNDDSHNCGSLVYVRVEYAGFAISEGNEINVVTFYACGSETTVHHVQAHMGLDDGLEMFGGTFDFHHIVVTGAADDSIDLDQGFRGTGQHIFLQQDPAVGDACYEISNQGSVFTATPLTEPVICNSTCIGSGASGEKSKGIILKEGTRGDWYASIFTNTTNEAVLLSDESTYNILDAGGITLANDIFFGNGDPEFRSGADSLDDAGWAAWVMDAGNANLGTDPGLGTTWGSPDASPSGDVSGNGTVGSGCEPTDYIGAVDPNGEDWTQASWINWVP
ncbi:MAG: hypothetical protein R6X02_18495 [Enhygromyxa sp.]